MSRGHAAACVACGAHMVHTCCSAVPPTARRQSSAAACWRGVVSTTALAHPSLPCTGGSYLPRCALPLVTVEGVRQRSTVQQGTEFELATQVGLEACLGMQLSRSGGPHDDGADLLVRRQCDAPHMCCRGVWSYRIRHVRRFLCACTGDVGVTRCESRPGGGPMQR